MPLRTTLLALLLCLAPGWAADPPLRSGCEIDYPPFCMVGSDGSAQGFSVELLRAALAAMGRDASFRTGTWTEIKDGLARRELEALPLVGRTAEREADFDFTFPYMTLTCAIVVRAEVNDIRSLSDLRGRRVAVLAGDNVEEFLRREERGFEILPLPSLDTALRELAAGRYDAVIAQRLVALRLIQAVGLTGLHVIERPIDGFRQDFCFAVAEGDRATLALLNEGLAAVMADGTYQRLHAKWFAAMELPHRRLRLGGKIDAPPYEFLDANGRPAGYAVELTRAVASEMGFDVDIRLGRRADMATALENGEIDAIQGLFYLPERQERFAFSTSHHTSQFVGVVRAGTAPPATLTDLAGRSLVIERGSAIHDHLVAKGRTDGLACVDSQADALRALVTGTADCTVMPRRVAQTLIAELGLPDLEVGRDPLLTLDYCFATRKGDKALLAQLNEGIRTIEGSGEYHRIHDAWLGIDANPHLNLFTALRYSAMFLVPLALVLALAFLWSWSLRRQVAEKTAALSTSEAKFRQLFENMTAGFALHEMIFDAAGAPVDYRFLELNPAFERLTGARATALVGRTVKEVMPDTEAFWIETYGKVAKTGEPAAFEHYAQAIGKHYDVFAFAPQRGRFATVFVDITERKRAEAALRASEENLRVTFASIGDAVISTGTNGRIVRMNPVAERLTGWSQADSVGRPLPEVFRIIDSQTRDPLPDPVARVLATGETVGLSDRAVLLAKVGTERQIADSGAPIRDADGAIVGVVLVFRDVTAERAMQERLQQSQKMDAIGQLAGGIAHDFNNMLGGIMAAAELLATRLGEDAKATKYLMVITESTQRAAELTRNLLSFARRQVVGSTPIDVHRAVRAAIDLLANTIDRRISIETDLSAPVAQVVGEPALLQGVFLNLGINAAHAMPEGGVLRFASRVVEIDLAYCRIAGLELAPGSFLEIEVRDTGCGIPPEHLGKLFTPFFTTKGHGTGLGLASAHGTILQHHGAITVSSEVGAGTAFRILLPLTERRVATDRITAEPVRGSGLVLLVDDELVMRTCGAAILEEAGYQVMLASDGAAAVTLYRQHATEIDLVILDMVMPKLNGRDCFHALRAIRADARIVLASGFSREEDVQDLRSHGLAGFIAKPYHGWEMTRVVARALGRAMIDPSAG